MNMKKIFIGDAAEIRRRSGMVIDRRNMAVEINEDLDGQIFMTIYKRVPGAWWQVIQFTIDIDVENGIATIPENMPVALAAAAINAAAGHPLVRARNLGATCPQCGVAHDQWVEAPIGLHCALCGWVAGTRPHGHVEKGARFWIPTMGRVVVHPRTRVRILAAHNQATGCARDDRLWARPGELPDRPLELRQVARVLPGYEHIHVEVVELPSTWDPPRG